MKLAVSATSSVAPCEGHAVGQKAGGSRQEAGITSLFVGFCTACNVCESRCEKLEESGNTGPTAWDMFHSGLFAIAAAAAALAQAAVFPVPPFARTLQYADPAVCGPDVTVYQNLALHWRPGVLSASGCFDNATAEATRAFQNGVCGLREAGFAS